MFVLGLALLVAYSILDKPVHSPFYDWWQVVKYRDRVQKEYGLTIREIKIHWPEYDREVTCFAVASVKPGGKAEKLGFKVGDIFLRKVKSLSGNRTQSRARRRASRTRRLTEVRLGLPFKGGQHRYAKPAVRALLDGAASAPGFVSSLIRCARHRPSFASSPFSSDSNRRGYFLFPDRL